MAAALHATGAGAASSSTTVAATVPSATSLDIAGCATGTSGVTTFGTVLPGSSSVTTGDCVVLFGSSNDTSQLRLYQADESGVAMHPHHANGTVAHYAFTNDYADSSMTGNAATPGTGASAPTFVTPGSRGNGPALRLSGAQHAAAPHAAALDLDTFTVDAWIRVTGNPGVVGDDTVIASKSAGSTSRNFHLTVRKTGATTAVLREGISFGGTGAASVGTSNVADGSWHHVAYVVDSTPVDPNKTRRLYVDGVLERTATFGGNVDNPARGLDIGYRGVNNDDFFQGDIDELRVHPRALTQAELQAYVGDTVGVADYQGGVADWTAGSGAFGACLRAVASGAAGTWPVAASNACTAANGSHWNGVVASRGSTSKIAHAASAGTLAAEARLRFGFRASSSLPPGRYEAPLTFEVLAPNS